MARKRGKIKFVGLRYFLEKSEGRVSRKELVEKIHRFFSSKDIKFGVLRVEFRRTKKPTAIIDGQRQGIGGVMLPMKNLVIVYINDDYPQNIEEVLRVVGHELDHVAWEKEGKVFDDTVSYWNREHEIRARKVGARWATE